MNNSARIRILSFIACSTLFCGCSGVGADDGAWIKEYNQGSLEVAKANYPKAEELRKQLLADAHGDKLEELLSYGGLAKLYREEGKFDESIETSKNGIRKAIANGDPDSLNLGTHLLLSLARLYQNQKKSAAEITKLHEDFKLPPIPASPIADKQGPYLNAITATAQKTWQANPQKPGKAVSLLLILTPQAQEKTLIVAESSGDAALDQLGLDAVHKCAPYPAFSELPEHNILGLFTFRTSIDQPMAPMPAAQPTPSGGKTDVVVPDLPLPKEMIEEEKKEKERQKKQAEKHK